MDSSKEFDLISEPEMARQLQRLKEHRHITEAAFRYTISDIAFLTGWTENYIRKLEKDGKIPESFRDDVVRGFSFRRGPGGKLVEDAKNRKGRRYWEEKGARAIIFFALEQQPKSARLDTSAAS